MKRMHVRLAGICLLVGLTAGTGLAQKKKATKTNVPASTVGDRQFWLAQMDKMVRPIVVSLAHDSLRIVMPKVVSRRIDNRDHRIQVQYVEVLGRVLSGIAPWLQGEFGPAHEVALRKQHRQWVLQATVCMRQKDKRL